VKAPGPLIRAAWRRCPCERCDAGMEILDGRMKKRGPALATAARLPGERDGALPGDGPGQE